MGDKELERACTFFKSCIENLRTEENEAHWNFSDYKNNLAAEQWDKVSAAFYHVIEVFEQQDRMLEDFHSQERTVTQYEEVLWNLECAVAERKRLFEVFKAEVARNCPEYDHDLLAHKARDEVTLEVKQLAESHSVTLQDPPLMSASKLLESVAEAISSEDDRYRFEFAHDVVRMVEQIEKEQMEKFKTKTKQEQEVGEEDERIHCQSLAAMETELEVTKANEQALVQNLSAATTKIEELNDVLSKYNYLKLKFTKVNNAYEEKKIEKELLKAKLEEIVAKHQSALDSERLTSASLKHQLNLANSEYISTCDAATRQVESSTAKTNSLELQLDHATTKVLQYEQDLFAVKEEYQKEHVAKIALDRDFEAEKVAHEKYQALFRKEREHRRGFQQSLAAKKDELAKVILEKGALEGQLEDMRIGKLKEQKRLRDIARKHYSEAFGDEEDQDIMGGSEDTAARRGLTNPTSQTSITPRPNISPQSSILQRPNVIPRPTEPLPPQDDLPERSGYFPVRSHYRAKRGSKLQSP